MHELAPKEWDLIAQQYAEGTPISAIAKSFNVSRDRIRRHADKMGWKRHRPCGEGRERDAPKEPPEPSQHSPERNRTRPYAEVVEQHKAAWAAVYSVRDEAFRILRGEPLQLLGTIEIGGLEARVALAATMMNIFRKDAHALAIAQEGERRAYGVDYRQQQKVAEDNEANVRRKRELAASIIRNLQEAADQRRAYEQAQGQSEASA